MLQWMPKIWWMWMSFMYKILTNPGKYLWISEYARTHCGLLTGTSIRFSVFPDILLKKWRNTCNYYGTFISNIQDHQHSDVISTFTRLCGSAVIFRLFKIFVILEVSWFKSFYLIFEMTLRTRSYITKGPCTLRNSWHQVEGITVYCICNAVGRKSSCQ